MTKRATTKRGKGDIKSMKSLKQKGLPTLISYMCVQGGGGRKLVIRCVRTKWMAPMKKKIFFKIQNCN